MDCNSICKINASNNLHFSTESPNNILVYNLDKFRMELYFKTQKAKGEYTNELAVSQAILVASLYSYSITYPEWSALMLETPIK
jgi:hypothetical protein